MVILMRLYPDRHILDQGEEDLFIEWLRSLGIQPYRVRAAAIEAPATAGPDEWYLLHLAEFVTEPDSNSPHGESPVLHPATGEPTWSYRTLRLNRADWPIVRVLAERR